MLLSPVDITEYAGKHKVLSLTIFMSNLLDTLHIGILINCLKFKVLSPTMANLKCFRHQCRQLTVADPGFPRRRASYLAISPKNYMELKKKITEPRGD